MRFRAFLALLVLLAALTYAPAGGAMGSSSVAAVQVVLFNRGLYRGTIDGVKGPMTTVAVRRFQQRRGLVADLVLLNDAEPAHDATGARTVRSPPPG